MRIDAASLVTDVRTFIALTGMAESTVGRFGLKDPNFVQRINAAEKVEFQTAVKAREFMVRVLEDSKHPEKKKFRAEMQKWIETNPTPPERPKPKAVVKKVTEAAPIEVKPNPQWSEEVALLPSEQQVSKSVLSSPRVVSVSNKKLAKGQQYAARKQKQRITVSRTLGAELQEVALRDDVKDAVNVLRRKWPIVWKAICQLAADNKERPIPLMISMLEAQIKVAK